MAASAVTENINLILTLPQFSFHREIKFRRLFYFHVGHLLENKWLTFRMAKCLMPAINSLVFFDSN